MSERTLKFPENPTDEQIEAITLGTIRHAFEPSATNLRDLTIPGDGTWNAIYSVGQMDFKVEWNGTEFIKEAVGSGS